MRRRFLRAFRRFLLKLVFGESFGYVQRSVTHVPMRGCHYVDILVRRDGVDRRVEADWLKKFQELLGPAAV